MVAVESRHAVPVGAALLGKLLGDVGNARVAHARLDRQRGAVPGIRRLRIRAMGPCRGLALCVRLRAIAVRTVGVYRNLKQLDAVTSVTEPCRPALN